jgi:guanosine-3',5'-bis(diphosphate) 3'-pyrophosphohydrolase
MNDSNRVLFAAIAFAARAHRHQFRKDGATPYVSHAFRVCMIVRHLFGIDDPNVLAAALLHDTIEDTTTDYDDIADEFGAEVADWVSALTKEMRLPEREREANYHAALSAAPWPVYACKLADIYDNLTDSEALSPSSRVKTIRRSEAYLAILELGLSPETEAAYALTVARLAEVKASRPV